MKRKIGTLLGPAAAGKDTVLNKLSTQEGYKRIVNDTTRQPRPGETEGLDYYFVDLDEYAVLKDSFAYITTNSEKGRHYGVRKSEVESAWQKDLLPIGHFGMGDHTNLWAADDRDELAVQSALLLTPTFKVWQDRMESRVQSGFIDERELFIRAKDAVRELDFATRNAGRFAVILSIEGNQTLADTDHYFRDGIKPPTGVHFIEDMAQDFDSFLGVHGERY